MNTTTEFIATGTVWVKDTGVKVEIEGNLYDVRKEDMRKIVEMRQAQGYSSLKDALHGAEAKFKVVRGSKKVLLVETKKPFEPELAPAPVEVRNDNLIVISDITWIDDSNEAEEGGYYESSAIVKGKKIKIEVWKKKPDFDGGYGTEFRQAVAKNGDHYWARPLGQFAFWPDTNFND